MLFTRYHLAASVSSGKDVLEVACGPGLGLGYLLKTARVLVGGDYDEVLLRHAQSHYRNGVRLLRLDASALPFVDRSFDVVVLFEAVYYLERPEEALREAHRVLRTGGTLLVCTANKDWAGFNPSPFAYRYFSAPEMYTLLRTCGFVPQLYGGFPAAAMSLRDRVLSTVRRLAVAFHLIPGTMKGKELLKKLVYGKLMPLPHEVRDAMAPLSPLVPLPGTARAPRFKVLYAVARLP